MKKISILFSLVLLASSCVRQMEEPESAKIAGMWAVVDDNDFATKYIEFGRGVVDIYVSDQVAYYVAGKSVWGSPEGGFKQLSSSIYSLIDGTLHYGNSHQKMRVEGDTMTLGDMKCRLVENFCPEYYSTINVSTPTQSFAFNGGGVEWSYNITQPVEGFVLKAKGPDWVSGFRVTADKISFTVPEATTTRTGIITLSYPSAEDLKILVTQCAAEINLDKASVTLGYAASSSSFTYSIPDPQDGYTLKVETNCDWITDVKDNGSSISFSVKENNSGSSRTGKITVTYAGVSKVFTVTQSYTASGISLSPTSGSHDYASGTYNFKYTITNPREGQEASVSTSDTWITGVTDNNGSVSYTVSRNTTGSSRSGKITVKYGDSSKTFTITQSAASLTLSSSSATCTYASATKSFDITIPNQQSDLAVSIQSDASWITGVSESNGTVTYTIAKNNSSALRTGKIIVTYAGVSEEFTVTQKPLIDLSESATANCYIVTSAGEYRFRTVKGNSSTSVGTVSTAEVLWESLGNSSPISKGKLLTSAYYKDDYVIFETNSSYAEGNAVIAAKDAGGNILWSWHIWLTDQPQGQVYYNGVGTMMDRNLGANNTSPSSFASRGLLYQWGRKDPFLGPSSISSDVEATSTITWPSPVASTSSTGTVDYVTSHPTVFVTASSQPYDWHYSSRDNTLWTTSDKTKSIYDPCPAGWRVPDGGRSGVWSTAGFDDTTYDKTNKGISFSISSPSTTWYPAAGYRGYNDGGLCLVGFYCNCWSASPCGEDAYDLHFNRIGAVDPSYSGNRAYGFSVRCLQE